MCGRLHLFLARNRVERIRAAARHVGPGRAVGPPPTSDTEATIPGSRPATLRTRHPDGDPGREASRCEAAASRRPEAGANGGGEGDRVKRTGEFVGEAVRRSRSGTIAP